MWTPGQRPREAVRAAGSPGLLLVKETAGHMKNGFGIEITVTLPQLEKGDPLRVPEQPGCLVIERGGAFIQRAHSQGHMKASALRAEPSAGRLPFRGFHFIFHDL
jgi:hypothetical protein